MTQREFYTAVISTVDNEELKDFATNAIAKLDERNAKRKGEESKKAKENAPIKEAILGVLTHEPMTASDIASAISTEDSVFSVQKVSALLRQIDGLSVTDIKVPKKGKCKGYALAE